MPHLSKILISMAVVMIGSIPSIRASLAATPLRGEYSFNDIQTKPNIKRGSLEELMQVDVRGGAVVPIPDFDLSKPGAKWEQNGLQMNYEAIAGTPFGCYRLKLLNPTTYLVAMSIGAFKAKANRSYLVSALINTEFDRTQPGQKSSDGTEINIGTSTAGQKYPYPADLPKGGDYPDIGMGLWSGVPDKSAGWVRWEFEYPNSSLVENGRAWLRFFNLRSETGFRVADLKIIEMPAKPLKQFGRGQGVMFRGGPGDLPMRVESATENGDVLSVQTTGARYDFDRRRNTIRAVQRINKIRAVTQWQSSLPLRGLQVSSRTATECVLTNGNLTLGVQCDGMMLVSPQKELALTLTSQIGGKWNRLIAGQLLAIDEWGGFTVNPAIPLGSGRTARTSVLTPQLDFLGRVNDTHFVSSAAPGWKVRWDLSPGERLGISTFPPRSYPWKKSFEMNTTLMYPDYPTATYQKELTPQLFDSVILWNYAVRGYGMTFGPRYEVHNEKLLREHIALVKAKGMRALPYLSGYFYYSRDPAEYVSELKRWKQTYGIDGFYTDGLPDLNWLLAYEEMRMARELFPSGDIWLHSTGQGNNGGPPLALPDIYCPFIDTYADATVRGEWLPFQGRDWPYTRYITSQSGTANIVGVTKGDRWNIPQSLQNDFALLNNGRSWSGAPYNEKDTEDWRIYMAKLRVLQSLWREKGKDPDFYEKYYLPKARELAELKIPIKDASTP